MSITVPVAGINFVFDFETQRIDVPATESALDVYVLWQAIRMAQEDPVGMAYNVIAKAGGLDTLDPVLNIDTFITVTLFENWEVNSLLTSGNFTLSGGNLLREDGQDPFLDNPLVSYFAFFSQAGTVTTINTGSGVTEQDKIDIKNLIYNELVEDDEPLIELLRILRAESAGKVNISGDTVSFRNKADTDDRIVAETDNTGQRLSITTNGT